MHVPEKGDRTRPSKGVYDQRDELPPAVHDRKGGVFFSCLRKDII